MVGIPALPQSGGGQGFWGRNARYLYTTNPIMASSTQPFTGSGVLIFDAALSSAQGATSTTEIQISDVTALGLVVMNNGSGQTITALTLTDGDTLPDGIAVPGVSYQLTTDVLGNATNIPSGEAQRFHVPITQGPLRKWYLKPTYGGATSAGTGTLDVLVVVESN